MPLEMLLLSWQIAGQHTTSLSTMFQKLISPSFLPAPLPGWISKRTAGSPAQPGKSLAQHCSEPLALSLEHATIDAAPCGGDA